MPLIQTRGSYVGLTHRWKEGNSLDTIIRLPLEAALVQVHFPAQARSHLLTWSRAGRRSLLQEQHRESSIATSLGY